jgi:hypothetical protein
MGLPCIDIPLEGIDHQSQTCRRLRVLFLEKSEQSWSGKLGDGREGFREQCLMVVVCRYCDVEGCGQVIGGGQMWVNLAIVLMRRLERVTHANHPKQTLGLYSTDSVA